MRAVLRHTPERTFQESKERPHPLKALASALLGQERRGFLTAPKASKTEVIQEQAKGNAEQTPNRTVRPQDRRSDADQEEYHGRNYVEDHANGHVCSPLQEKRSEPPTTGISSTTPAWQTLPWQ